NPAISTVPIVNFGYARYRPTAVNITGQYYNFSNIRYAAPPVGHLRWRAPVAPPRDPRSTREYVSDGSLGYICPQAQPQWFTQANTALGNLSAVISPAASSQAENEDCLFLDVIVPIRIFQQRASRKKLAPVLFNIHGGGFFIGEKRALYPPNGLLEAANNDFIYVSINYRKQLGAFGFLSHLQPSSDNVTSPNAGLLDQRFALKWVHKYIHLFGGDPHQVTITGESAGGGSVQYQTTAYGGAKETNLFIRGIAQSPAPCLSDPVYPALGANLFLQNAGVGNLTAARRLSTQVLQQANINAQNATPFNVFYFGPTVDADFIPNILPRSYSQGKYVKTLELVAANNQDETRFLGNQSIETNADFDNWVHINFPSAPSKIQNEIINRIYPPVYDGSSPYATPQERSDLAVREYLISCQTVSIANAYKNQTHNYIFSIAPAIHAQDLAYTYYPNGATPDFYPNIAITLQRYLTNFVLTGDPNKDGLSPWPAFGPNAAALNLTETGISQTTSDSANSRCAFWNQGSYYPSASNGANPTSSWSGHISLKCLFLQACPLAGGALLLDLLYVIWSHAPHTTSTLALRHNFDGPSNRTVEGLFWIAACGEDLTKFLNVEWLGRYEYVTVEYHRTPFVVKIAGRSHSISEMVSTPSPNSSPAAIAPKQRCFNI
ncbi:hypothetical protein Q9189_003299, partial [Teloschistes chrysophthalmus]